MELDTKSISILNKPRKTVTSPRLLTINHERQNPYFALKPLPDKRWSRKFLDLNPYEIETMLKEWGKELTGQKPSGLKRLGIDEIALVKGQKNSCVVLVDIDKKIIVGMLNNRTQVEVEKYLQAWGEEVLEQIEACSIDM